MPADAGDIGCLARMLQANALIYNETSSPIANDRSHGGARSRPEMQDQVERQGGADRRHHRPEFLPEQIVELEATRPRTLQVPCPSPSRGRILTVSLTARLDSCSLIPGKTSNI
jgi:hypothetical protein